METIIKKDKWKKFTGNRPGNKWYRRFVKRNPKVRLSVHPLNKKCQITPKQVDEWFANFEKFIQVVGVAGHKGQNWTCNGTGLDLQGRAGKVLCQASRINSPIQT